MNPNSSGAPSSSFQPSDTDTDTTSQGAPPQPVALQPDTSQVSTSARNEEDVQEEDVQEEDVQEEDVQEEDVQLEDGVGLILNNEKETASPFTAEATPSEVNSSLPEASSPQANPSSQETTSLKEAPSLQEDPSLQLSFSTSPDAPFQTSLTLDLRCSSPGAKIYYALGAADVDEHGLPFDAKNKILLTQTTLVAARAFEGGRTSPLLVGKFEIRKPIWQELEPSESSDPTPHKAHEVLATPDAWHVAAGSVRGKLHAHRALWREDSFALANVETEGGAWSVIVVSDGAGSAPLSRVGSRVACAVTVASLRASLSQMVQLAPSQEELVAHDLPALREALMQSAVDALKAIREEGQQRGKPLTAFAATLLVLVRRAWNEAQLCAALQVGDGALALWEGDGLTMLGEADHGEHSSETRFLTTTGIETELASRVKFSIKTDLRATLVISDGVSDDYFPEDKRLGEVFEAVLPLVKNEDEAGAALVAWLGYEKKGSSDDRTLVMSWPGGEELRGQTDLAAELAALDRNRTLPLKPTARPESPTVSEVPATRQPNREASDGETTDAHGHAG